MSEQAELKPCPFEYIPKDYQHKRFLAKGDDSCGLYRVACACGARGPVMGMDKKSAVDAWNTRTSEAEVARHKEELAFIGKVCTGENQVDVFDDTEALTWIAKYVEQALQGGGRG